MIAIIISASIFIVGCIGLVFHVIGFIRRRELRALGKEIKGKLDAAIAKQAKSPLSLLRQENK